MVNFFNLGGVGAISAILLVLLGVEYFSPELMAAPNSGWTIGIASTLVGVLCDLSGLKARIFLLPIWMFGLGIICYQFGAPGIMAFVGLLIIGSLCLYNTAKKREAATWRKIRERASITARPPAFRDDLQFWAWVKATSFLPILLPFTPDLCAHNLKVLGVIEAANLSLSPREKARLHALRGFLSESQSAAKPHGSDMAVQNDFARLVDSQLKKAKRSVHRPKPAAPRAVPAAH